MKDKLMENEIKKVLQMVHDDAISSTHDPRLGYSTMAFDMLLALFAKEKEKSFIQGFLAGFDQSAEGYNGEYIHPSLRKGNLFTKRLIVEADKAFIINQKKSL